MFVMHFGNSCVEINSWYVEREPDALHTLDAKGISFSIIALVSFQPFCNGKHNDCSKYWVNAFTILHAIRKSIASYIRRSCENFLCVPCNVLLCSMGGKKIVGIVYKFMLVNERMKNNLFQYAIFKMYFLMYFFKICSLLSWSSLHEMK